MPTTKVIPHDNVMTTFLHAAQKEQIEMIRKNCFKDIEEHSLALFHIAQTLPQNTETIDELMQRGASPGMIFEKGSHDARYAGGYARVAKAAASYYKDIPAMVQQVARWEKEAAKKEERLGPATEAGTWNTDVWSRKYAPTSPLAKAPKPAQAAKL